MNHEAKMSRSKKSSFQMDEKDEAILHCLEQTPKILLKNIPNALVASGGPAIPYTTVQKRVKKLTARRIIDRHVSINWVEAGYLVRYRVGVLIDPTALRDSAITGDKYDSQPKLANYIMRDLAQGVRFKNRLVVDDVYILLGGSVDLAIDFYARDDKTATQFIIDALRNLPGIRDTVSAKLAYSTKHSWLSKNGDE
ncbi:MAG: Lrp/AsnC family transcriptional regulator [Pyrinomonadaceae bacterium]|nr:Lrp/AsnC family transcriptional regulator [Pyrinomonadaceae bacterium]